MDVRDFLKVEINDPPKWSYLLFYPDPKKPTLGMSLVNSSDRITVNLLKILKERLENG
jgi:hypothetical protein